MIERRDDFIFGDSWEEMEIDIPPSKAYASTNIKIKNCPTCKDLGKKNDYSLSVNPAEGKSSCHKCGTKYIIRDKKPVKETKKEEKVFTPPSKKNLTKLSESGLKYFVNRRLSQEAVTAFKITESTDGWIAFPYLFNGELVNVKYKQEYHEEGKRKKKFKQSPNGMHVMFNYDEAKKHKKVIICEGEEEAMCWFDAGFPYAVSVDSGAPNPKDVIDRKLECFTNCFDLFENAEEVYIAVDNDENGKRLAEELERRLDIEKVKRIDFGAYKDANDVLMYEGVESLQHLYKIAKEVKMEGIFTVEDVQDQLLYNYRNGLPKGTTTHMPSIDNIWKWRESEVNTISGYANEGKSSLFNINLPVLKAVFDGWKFALFIPENFPAEQFFEDVIHCYIGKPTDIDWKFGRMTEEEFMRGLEFVKNHFFLVYPEKGFTLENIFVRFDYLVRKHGVRSVIIDPFNTVEHLFKAGETYDQYVSRFMGELIKFTQKRRLATLLVAHQNKPEKKLPDGNYPEPEPYNTKGGGTFFDKTHNYLTVWRPYRNTDRNNPLVTVTSKKIKMKKLVANVGSADIQFNWKTNRYEDPLLEFKNPLDKFSGMSSIKKVASDEDEELPF